MSLTKVSYSMITGASINVLDYGAKGDGVTNDLAAIQLAAAAMTDNSTLYFPKGTYLLDWAGAKPIKHVIAIDIFQLTNIKIIGEGATIYIDDHNTETYGGLLFCRPRACKNLEIYGFDVRMSFVNSNKDAAYYPESGFLYAHNTEENASVLPVPAEDRLENISVHDCYFDMRSTYGCYTTSQNPYFGDSNNGGKYYSVFIRGELAEPDYNEQNKGCQLYNLTWSDTHECYMIWVWGFSDVNIHHNSFQGIAVRVCNYQGTMIGGGVPAIRCHKFFTRNWQITNNILQGRPPQFRTGTQDGGCAFISFQQENSAYNIESNVVIENNTLCVGSNIISTSVDVIDIGVQLLSYSNFRIINNAFSCNTSTTLLGATGIYLLNDQVDSGGEAHFIISGNTFDRSCMKMQSIAYVSGSNTSAATRSIKTLHITDNVFLGFYKNILEKVTTAKTYQGIEYQCVSNNSVFNSGNTFFLISNSACIAFQIYQIESGDGSFVNNNMIVSAYVGINVSGAQAANCIARNNDGKGIVFQLITGVLNYYPQSTPTSQVFAPGASVTITGSGNKIFGYIALETNASGNLVGNLCSTAGGGTTIASGSANTYTVFQWPIGDDS